MNVEKRNIASALAIIMSGLVVPALAWAKIPPASPEVQAKKDEAAAKTAFADKVAAYKLCLAQDRVAAAYRANHGDAKGVTPELPACQDPGAYVAAQEATKIGIADSLPLNKEPVKK